MADPAAPDTTPAPTVRAPAAPRGIDDLRKRADKAYQDMREWADEWHDLYDYVLPSRDPARRHDGTTSAAGTSAKISKAYDHTGGRAAIRFAGRMQQDVTPPFTPFFELEPGPAMPIKGEDQRRAVAEQLQEIKGMVMGVLESSAFSTASHEMYLDLFGGQGALLMLEDDDAVVEFVSVPASRVAIREDGRGRVTGIYWKEAYRHGDIDGMWPDQQLSSDLQNRIASQPEETTVIMQACEWDRKTRRWTFTVYEQEQKQDGPISQTHNMRTSPWLVPRFYKVPGRAAGIGPGIIALPTIKTLNKVTELTLKAAAFAILGLWTYRNDRVFNPAMSRMAPGQMWKVSANDGPLGRTIERLEVPGRFDISNIVLQDLREAVKQATFDDTLPPDSGAVRSATEIVERLKRLAADLAGAYARLVQEIIRPLVQRVIDVLHRRGLIDTAINIDQLIFKVKVTSPIARSAQAQDVSQIVDWLQIILSTGGQEAMMLSARVEKIFAEIGEKLGVPPHLIRGEAERGKLLEMVAAIIARAQMEGQQEAAAEPAAAAA